ncbi:MAG: hypothetical protein V2J08_05220 [Desulfotignum sp.]|jgi:hypothetical protein|nr:hypothetical protein [Desulfotignum sp.]
MTDFMEIPPGRHRLKRVYLSCLLWFFGRAVQAAARVDDGVKSEFAAMPDNFTFCLGAFPSGPYMVVGKDARGRVRHLGSCIAGRTIHLHLMFKSPALLFRVFAFQESTSVANARNRLYVHGDVPQACAVVRIMDMIQVFLLPKFLAKRAVKRYPAWSLKRRTLVRAQVYVRTAAGF